MDCSVFSRKTPTTICGKEAKYYAPVALGSVARMHDIDDALFCGFIPLCDNHASMTPPSVRLYAETEIFVGVTRLSDKRVFRTSRIINDG